MANQKCKVTKFSVYDGAEHDEEGNVKWFTATIQMTVKSKEKISFDERKLWDKEEELINSNEVKE